jgi:DDE superfamily endonuclease
MGASERFDRYLSHLSEGLGHLDRHAGLKGYCMGLMLSLARKSVEPMAARVDPMHASARYQSMQHFVAKAEWSDSGMLRRVCQWVVPLMDFSRGRWWIIDDTGFPWRGSSISPRIGPLTRSAESGPVCPRRCASPRRRRSRWRSCAPCWPKARRTIACWPMPATAWIPTSGRH